MYFYSFYGGFVENSINVVEVDIYIFVKFSWWVFFFELVVLVNLCSCDML